MAGYSSTPLARKLGIDKPMIVYTVDAPDEYRGWLGELQPGVHLRTSPPKPLTAAHVFVTRKDDLRKRLSTLRKSKNRWAQRIITRRGFKRVVQFTERDEGYDMAELSAALTASGVEHYSVESRGVLSKYFDEGSSPSLFVLDTSSGRLTEVSKYTPLYQRFSGAVRLSRLYVRPDQVAASQPLISKLTGALDAAIFDVEQQR